MTRTRADFERETQLNILKREMASEQLLRHTREVGIILSNRIETFVIGGDFNTNSDNPLFVSERTLTALSKEGFKSGFEAIAMQKRVTCPGKGRYLDATFDFVFVGAKSSTSEPEIFHSESSDHYPVTRVVMP